MYIKKLLTDIRFWIVFFFLFRLYGITFPPLEIGHNWRQTTVTMVARNYLEVDNNILYPRVDFAGEKTGITGMEFPILNYMIYLVSEVFGYQHWYGRLINLIISSLGIWFFFRLVKKYYTQEVAFYSSFILIVSIWFGISRKIMPDTFSMSLVIAALFYGTNYLEEKSKSYRNLLLYFILMVIGVLSKLPAGFILVVFGFFYLNKEITVQKKVILGVTTFIGLIPVVWWYFYWVPYLVEEYEFWHFFMGVSFSEGFQQIMDNLGKTLERFYKTPIQYSGLLAFLIGLFFAIREKAWKVYALFIITFLCFSIIVFKAGFTFYHHNHYIIPFTPVIALVAGYGISKIKRSYITWVFLLVIASESIGDRLEGIAIKEADEKIVNLESDLDKFSNRDDLILINSGFYPTPIYFTHRKGWIATNEMIANPQLIDIIEERGLKYIVILKRAFGTSITLPYKVILNNEDYAIYSLQKE